MPMTRRGQILLVEDEFLVATLVEELLDELGFDVFSAASARAALDFAARSIGDVVAAVVDLGLPDQAGQTLVGELRALRQDLPIIIATGRDQEETRERFGGMERLTVLRKPYGSDELSAALDALGIS
jgi:DNA-binding response OmpR family regulator